MVNSVVFQNGRIIMPTGIFHGDVRVENGIIQSIFIEESCKEDADIVIDLKEDYLSPGFIDIHTHGAGGADFMDQTEVSMYQACFTHLKHGTTSILPTTLTSTRESLMDFLEFFNTIELKKEGMPNILGLHLEGPYFAYSQKGAQDPKYLRNPDPDE